MTRPSEDFGGAAEASPRLVALMISPGVDLR